MISLASLIQGIDFRLGEAYVQTPVEAGQLFTYVTGELAANYGYMTAYDSQGGPENNVYFFPALESKASDSGSFFVSQMRITVTGTKPDGSAISGLEFLDLAHLTSPNNEGTQWDDALITIWKVVQLIDPVGLTSLIECGKGEGGGVGWSCGTDYDSTAAWAWYDASAMPPATKERGLQFRFGLHCDPGLNGTYALSIRFHLVIKLGLHSNVIVCIADFCQAVTYDFCASGPLSKLTISASSGGTTNPPPGTSVRGCNSCVTVSAHANTGYFFDHWIVDGSTVYGGSVTLTMESDHSLMACFTYMYLINPKSLWWGGVPGALWGQRLFNHYAL